MVHSLNLLSTKDPLAFQQISAVTGYVDLEGNAESAQYNPSDVAEAAYIRERDGEEVLGDLDDAAFRDAIDRQPGFAF